MTFSANNINKSNNIVFLTNKNTKKNLYFATQKDSFEKESAKTGTNSYSPTGICINPNSFINKVSFKGATAPILTKVTRLENSPVSILKKPDGGYLVDNDTKTVAYYGEDAKRYLNNVTNHLQDTQIIAQSDCDFTVKTLNGKEIRLDEPGAIMINKNSIAKVEVNKGNPLVLTTEAPPKWYKIFNSQNHEGYFDYLAKINNHLYNDEIPKRAFGKSYDVLKNAEIIADTQDKNYVKFNVKNAKDLENKIFTLDMTLAEKTNTLKTFNRSQEKAKSKIQTPGELTSNALKHLNSDILNILSQEGFTEINNANNIVWKDFKTKEDFKKELKEKTNFSKDIEQKVIETWEKTSKSGYDLTGLKDSGDGVAVYVHRGKINPYNYAATEWITNSTSWVPKGALTLGVSRMIAGNKKSKIRGFNSVRPEECIHKHQNPNNINEKMTESYILTKGKAAIYTEKNNSPEIEILNAGEMLVIPSGVKHGIIAIDGEYEHLCFQTPSSFQYGFKFKSEQKPFPKELIELAKTKLNNENE